MRMVKNVRRLHPNIRVSWPLENRREKSVMIGITPGLLESSEYPAATGTHSDALPLSGRRVSQVPLCVVR